MRAREKTVQDYFAALPAATRRKLQRLRSTIRAAVPGGTEGISYGIPVVRLDGKPVIYYAAFKNHCSLYPMTEAIRREHAAAIKGYETSKGTIRFPLAELPPPALVKRLVKARLAEFHAKNT